MLTVPFELLSVSWPRPVAVEGGRWTSEPEWNAPPSPLRPQPVWRMIDGEPAWTLDWCDLFRGGLAGLLGWEMRRFHVVFRIRAAATGPLVFWDDDGSIIRLGGRIVHEDRSVHPLRRSEVRVQAGDVLEVAHWQNDGGWMWGARTPSPPLADAEAVVAPYRDEVAARVHAGGGPPLKLYTDGRHPLRTVVGAYSLVLNGYAPSGILLYGANQWSAEAAAVLRAGLPFAAVVDPGRVLSAARALGGNALAAMVAQKWFVMKTCVALLDGPDECCMMDDDVFVLDPVSDALAAFAAHDLVFVPDTDYGAGYHRTWGPAFRRNAPAPTGTFNAGLYWCRRVRDRRWLAERMAKVRADMTETWLWEQGFVATAYADRAAHALPSNRYFYPLFEGLPGGLLGYDYAANPCGFASIHFGGLQVKLDDAALRWIAPSVLGRRAACAADPALARAG